MITALFFSIAGLLNAIMDTLDYHYDGSIFPLITKNKQFWKQDLSWQNKYNWEKWIPEWIKKTILSQFFDGWHIAKLLMITSFIISTVFYMSITGIIYLDIVILYLIFSITFEFWFRLLDLKNPFTDKKISNLTIDKIKKYIFWMK